MINYKLAKIDGIVVAVKESSQEVADQFEHQYYLHPTQISNQAVNEKGIFHKYNKGIEIVLSNSEPTSNSWIIFSHDDVALQQDIFKLKVHLSRMYEEKKADIVAAAGNTELPPINPGYWWYGITSGQFRGSGAIVHRTPDTDDMYHIESYGPYPQKISTFDGLWFAVRTELFKKHETLRFDENFNGYHYYDADFAATARSLNLNIWVGEILLLHFKWGKGITDPNFIKLQNQFVSKWSRQVEAYKNYQKQEVCSNFVKKTSAIK